MEARATDQANAGKALSQRRVRLLWVCVFVGTLILICAFLLICGNPLDGVWFNLRGKVVDQYGAPILHARITGEIARARLIDELLKIDFGAARNLNAEVDSNGGFHIWGFGTGLRIDPRAEGYISNVDENYELEGSSSVVDAPPSAPVYRLWKLNGPEPLDRCGFDCHDESVHWIDLLHANYMQNNSPVPTVRISALRSPCLHCNTVINTRGRIL
jgi:uncharacterized integral membrane protein